MKNIVSLFKVMVSDEKTEINTAYASFGFVTDFRPTASQIAILKKTFKPITAKTMFSVAERENENISYLLTKQILHYIEVYGLDKPGLFDLEINNEVSVPMAFVRGVSIQELSELVQNLLYSNAPIKDAVELKNIIDTYGIDYDINKIKNNELRVILFDVQSDTYESGDDAVRYLCYNATGNALLIKSPEVISAVRSENVGAKFFEKHQITLAKVFNRHKPIILAAKNKKNRSAINKIGRLSKTLHEPVHESISKRFVTEALEGRISDYSILDRISVRDKFKYLNLLAYKESQQAIDAFIIRNGKTHIEPNRKLYKKADISRVTLKILDSIKKDLSHLNGSTILLDRAVDYGLPVSRKQTLGNLPFGTVVDAGADEISAGMYWENSWGARDLDLSSIDINGYRTGWGAYSGYDNKNIITFSGDVTDARDGAMEFMTSPRSFDQVYGLFVNIFSGEPGAEMELVVGNKTKNRWIDSPVLREKHKLNSRGNIIGFVREGKLTVYSTRLSNRHTSSDKNKAIVARGVADWWTVTRLFDVLGIKYLLDSEVEVDYNLSYANFTYDKLESLMLNT